MARKAYALANAHTGERLSKHTSIWAAKQNTHAFPMVTKFEIQVRAPGRGGQWSVAIADTSKG